MMTFRFFVNDMFGWDQDAALVVSSYVVCYTHGENNMPPCRTNSLLLRKINFRNFAIVV